MYSGDRSMQVLVTYDSYASHSSITPEVARDLGLKQSSVGMLDIQHFGGNKQEEGFFVTANISPLSKPIQFLMGGCGQTLPSYRYEVPEKWEKWYGLNVQEELWSEGGINSVTLSMDQIELFPQVISVSNGVCISKSAITKQYILCGRAMDSTDNIHFQNKTVVDGAYIPWQHNEDVQNKCSSFSNNTKLPRYIAPVDVVSEMPDAPKAILHAPVVTLSGPLACEQSTRSGNMSSSQDVAELIASSAQRNSVLCDIVSGQQKVIGPSVPPQDKECVQSGQVSNYTALYTQKGRGSTYEEKLLPDLIKARQSAARLPGTSGLKREFLYNWQAQIENGPVTARHKIRVM